MQYELGIDRLDALDHGLAALLVRRAHVPRPPSDIAPPSSGAQCSAMDGARAGTPLTSSGTSDVALCDMRRAFVARMIAATSTSAAVNSHWLMTLSAGDAANNVIQVLAKIWKSWTNSRLPMVLLNIQLK